MGADMMVAAVAYPKGGRIDFKAGRKFVKEDLDWVRAAEELVACDLIYPDFNEELFNDDDTPIEAEIRKWLTARVDEFEELACGRYSTTLEVRDLVLVLTGGLSWGDAPEGADAMWAITVTPGLAEAMNIVTDWSMEALLPPPVSPDEERAAIESITRVGHGKE